MSRYLICIILFYFIRKKGGIKIISLFRIIKYSFRNYEHDRSDLIVSLPFNAMIFDPPFLPPKLHGLARSVNLPIIKGEAGVGLVIVGRVSISSAINLSESRLLSRDRTTCNTFSFTRTASHTRMDTYTYPWIFVPFVRLFIFSFLFFSLSFFFI